MKGVYKKNIGILGLGVTGISSLKFLEPIAHNIICWDDDATRNDNNIASKFLVPISDPQWRELDVIIVSPGIPKSHMIFSIALEYNILISSDIEVFLQNNPNSRIIAITGTNGKSTTASLIHHILSQNNIKYYLGGNIGNPVLSIPQKQKGYILELSSFQLDLLPKLNADISVLTNISSDHLDKYNSYEEYCTSKKKIISKNGINIIGCDTEDSKSIYQALKIAEYKRLISISKNYSELGIRWIFDERNKSISILDNYFDQTSHTLVNFIQNTNIENLAISFAACRVLGIQSNNIIPYFKTFKALKHRQQFIGKYRNINFYNDSKATNTHSTLSSLLSYQNILWIVGGILKEKKLSTLENAMPNICKAYIFGTSKAIIADYLIQFNIPYVICDDLDIVFFELNKDFQSKEFQSEEFNVILAPACSSTDQFTNFESRGCRFIDLFNKL